MFWHISVKVAMLTKLTKELITPSRKALACDCAYSSDTISYLLTPRDGIYIEGHKYVATIAIAIL